MDPALGGQTLTSSEAARFRATLSVVLRSNRAYRYVRASWAIAGTLLRYGLLLGRERLPFGRPDPAAWDRAHARTGRAIYRLATALGGAFVKLGQVLGARADFFPESLLGPLRALHDSVPPRPLEALRGHVEAELGRPLSAVFPTIEAEPLGAASLAQVHRARLVDGTDVAVKIQYPEARKLFPGDLASLRRAVRAVRLLNRRLDLRAMVDELAAFVTLELDFAREARSTQRARHELASRPDVLVPRVHEAISTDRLLVLEFIEGAPLSDLARVRQVAPDLRALAERVASVYCAMIFEHGFFHGDPHPGNILACADGRIALLDFGLAKELPAGFGAGVAAIIAGAMGGQPERAVAAARSIGFSIREGDPAGFVALIRALLGQYAADKGLLDLLQTGIVASVPSHFALIVRALILLNGLSHRLVPGQRIIAMSVAAQVARLVQAAGSGGGPPSAVALSPGQEAP